MSQGFELDKISSLSWSQLYAATAATTASVLSIATSATAVESCEDQMDDIMKISPGNFQLQYCMYENH